jgi:tetratricopeptide (TPR) repeat protein
LKRFAAFFCFTLFPCLMLWASGEAFAEGQRLLRDNKPKEAAAYLEKALKEGSPNEEAFLDLGMAYTQLERYDDSVAILKKGLLYSTQYKYLFYFNMGNAFYNQSKFTFAEEMYASAIEASSSYAEAYLNRANARMKLKNYHGAVGDYQFYLGLEPNSPQREKIERLIALVTASVEAEEKRAAEDEARRLAEEKRRKDLLDEVANSLKQSADETKSLSAGSEKVQGYDDDFQLAE